MAEGGWERAFPHVLERDQERWVPCFLSGKVVSCPGGPPQKGPIPKTGWQRCLLVVISRCSWSWQITHTVTLGIARSLEPRAGRDRACRKAGLHPQGSAATALPVFPRGVCTPGAGISAEDSGRPCTCLDSPGQEDLTFPSHSTPLLHYARPREVDPQLRIFPTNTDTPVNKHLGFILHPRPTPEATSFNVHIHSI